MDIDLDSLIAHLGKDARSILEGSSGKCVSRGGYEITIEDFLLELLDTPHNELTQILNQFEISVIKVNRAIQLSQDLRSGNTSHPVFSPLLIDWLQESWLLCSLKLNIDYISPGAMILALLANPNRFGRMAYFDLMESISTEKLFNLIQGLISDDYPMEDTLSASNTPSHNNNSDNALKKYTVDFTQQAEKGEIDPVFCRDTEIRQIIDVLARRRKNNPIAVGEPGVGKTAVVEGLALKIINGEVPDILKNVKLLGLDMGLLQAGASVKGEFEKRLKAVI
jgi:type VI secretion system protein VasG